MGKRSRSTGLRYEREALMWWRTRQLEACKTMPGGASQEGRGDIDVGLADGLKVEVKYSTTDRGARIVRQYLQPVDVLMLRAPGEDWIFGVKRETMEYLVDCARHCELLRGPREKVKVESDFAPRELPTLPNNETQAELDFYYPDGPHEGGWFEP